MIGQQSTQPQVCPCCGQPTSVAGSLPQPIAWQQGAFPYQQSAYGWYPTFQPAGLPYQPVAYGAPPAFHPWQPMGLPYQFMAQPFQPIGLPYQPVAYTWPQPSAPWQAMPQPWHPMLQPWQAMAQSIAFRPGAGFGAYPGPMPGQALAGQPFAGFPASLSDTDMQNLIYNTLDTDPFIPPEANIDVKVEAGTVMLNGEVPTKEVKQAAGNDAFWIPGVIDVQNQLKVTGRRARAQQQQKK
ncbi:MAG: BON domain-containing protein [Armatimonadetes bacterium]|nr:BON domain-containing protein [Armatimonadota bacterium]